MKNYFIAILICTLNSGPALASSYSNQHETADVHNLEKLFGKKRQGKAAHKKFTDRYRKKSTEEQDLERILRDEPSASLHRAAIARNLDGIDIILGQGVDVNTAPEEIFGATALHCAAYTGAVDAAKRLIQRGANINAQNTSGATPLMAAIKGGHTAVIKLLLDKGALLNDITTNSQQTALDVATWHNKPEISTLLNKRGAQQTLTSALIRGDKEFVSSNISGKNINQPIPGTMMTPLALTVRFGQGELFDYLVSRGADVNTLSEDFSNDDLGWDEGFFDLFGAEPAPLLTLAINHDMPIMVKKLVKAGAKLDKTLNPMHPLSRAVSMRNPEIIKAFLQAGVDLNSFTSSSGTTLLDEAENPAIVNLLRSHGVHYSLYGAVETGDLSEVRKALNRTKNVNQLFDSTTALSLAVSRGHNDIVTYLLENNADVNTPRIGQGNPLVLSLTSRNFDISNQLIKAGADVSAKIQGITFLHIAASFGAPTTLIRTLIDKGLSKESRDAADRRPYDYARMRQHKHLLEILR